MDLEELKHIMDIEDGESIFFDMDMNRHFYVQVPTKPASFMTFKDLIVDMNQIFNEWMWVAKRINDRSNVDIWVL